MQSQLSKKSRLSKKAHRKSDDGLIDSLKHYQKFYILNSILDLRKNNEEVLFKRAHSGVHLFYTGHFEKVAILTRSTRVRKTYKGIRIRDHMTYLQKLLDSGT